MTQPCLRTAGPIRGGAKQSKRARRPHPETLKPNTDVESLAIGQWLWETHQGAGRDAQASPGAGPIEAAPGASPTSRDVASP